MEVLSNCVRFQLGYSFNNIGFLNKIGVSDLNLSLVGRNLWIIHKNIPDLDPEVSSECR